MSVADFLEDVGKGLESGLKTTGRVAKAVAPALGKSIVNEEAGYAPQIAAEQRNRQYQQEDQLIAAKEAELTRQLEMGRKYGTLTPEQQAQYVDQITGLYSHPRHAGTLMEKLRQAVHPNGAIAGPPPQLKDATPTGGTAAADEQRAAELASARYNAMRANNPKLVALDKFTMDKYGTDFNSSDPDQQAAALDNYVRHSTKQGAGKSLPVPGTQLPPDAVGPNGQPLPPEARTAGRSFVEQNGTWYDAPKPKPVYRNIGGNVYLMNPTTGMPERKLGPQSGVKVTVHDSPPFLGDDGLMHTMKLYSVTTPQGESIDVDLDPTGMMGGGEEKPQSTLPKSESAAPKKANVGSLLPKAGTGTKPVAAGSVGGPPNVAGRAIPGTHDLANTKNPLYRANVASYKKAQDDVVAATKLSSLADQVALNPDDAINQKRLAVALERTSAGRFTTQALDYIIQAGWGNTIETWANRPDTGALPPDVMRQLVDGAHQNLAAAKDAVKVAQDVMNGKEPQEMVNGHAIGETKKFPNNKTGVWDGHGWVAQ